MLISLTTRSAGGAYPPFLLAPAPQRPRHETLAVATARLGERALEPVELSRLLSIVMQACDAVGHVHARGVIHGALDPSSVLIGRDDAVSIEDSGARPRLVSAAFLSTEQAWSRRANFDARTDVYALGGMLFAILTSRPPHDQPSFDLQLAAARRGVVPPPQDVCPNRPLPAALCRIASRALSASPADRHGSVALLKQDLERFVRSLPKPVPAPQPGSLPALSA